MTKCQKDPTCGISLKRGLFKGIKNYIPTCRMHKYKNTNTKYTNTAYEEVPERPSGIFLKRGLFKDTKNYISMCQTYHYKHTNTKYTNSQIQHITKCQKDPTCGIFLKRGLFKGIKNYIPIQYKLEHLSFAQLYVV